MVQFWVQIHDVRLEIFNAAKIGNKIGKFIEVEKEIEKATSCHLRMKVEVDVSQSLLDGFWWKNSEGKENWVSIKYERLFDFCYGCGKLRHTTQVSKEKVQMSEEKPRHTMYAPWLIGRKL